MFFFRKRLIINSIEDDSNSNSEFDYTKNSHQKNESAFFLLAPSWHICSSIPCSHLPTLNNWLRCSRKCTNRSRCSLFWQVLGCDCYIIFKLHPLSSYKIWRFILIFLLQWWSIVTSSFSIEFNQKISRKS